MPKSALKVENIYEISPHSICAAILALRKLLFVATMNKKSPHLVGIMGANRVQCFIMGNSNRLITTALQNFNEDRVSGNIHLKAGNFYK